MVFRELSLTSDLSLWMMKAVRGVNIKTVYFLLFVRILNMNIVLTGNPVTWIVATSACDSLL